MYSAMKVCVMGIYLEKLAWDLQRCTLLKDSVFVLWINNYKCS